MEAPEGAEFHVHEVDYTLEEGLPVIRIFGRAPEGSSLAAFVNDFRPYFYCMAEAGSNPRELVRRILSPEISEPAHIISARVDGKTWLGQEVHLVRVTLDSPRNVRTARALLQQIPAVKDTFEKDILFKRRFLIDRGINPLGVVKAEGYPRSSELPIDRVLEKARVVAVEEDSYLDAEDLKLAAFDVEVSTHGEPNAETDPIIMIGLGDREGIRILTYGAQGDGMESYDSEREMISNFVSIVQREDYDLLVGYNSDSFDLPYLKTRARRNGIKLSLGRDGSEVSFQPGSVMGRSIIRGRINVDLYPPSRRMLSLPSYTLSHVYQYLSGRAKQKLTPGEILALWTKGDDSSVSRIARYCSSDVEATLYIASEILPTLVELSKNTKQLLSDVARMGQSQMVEWLLIREAYRRGELVPNRPTSPELAKRGRETYEGGFVLEPRKGLHENIVSLDFRSLYPTIIVTHNVDMATLDCSCCPGENVAPTGHHFCKRREGFIPSILSRLIERRAEIKDQLGRVDPSSSEFKKIDAMQQALKILSNSFYGYSGYPRARWYSKECAESVAAWGRHYIKYTIQSAETEGFEVLYSDTDSIFITKSGLEREGLIRQAQEFLQRLNSSLPGIIQLEYEGFSPRGFFVSKKRYALLDKGGKIVTRGLEVVRRDWSPIAKETQRRVLRAILEDGDPQKAAEEVRKTIRALSERSVDLTDLVISTRMMKTIQSYEAQAPHVALAKRLARDGTDVELGSSIDYIVRKGGGKVGDRAQPVEEARLDDYDIEYYIRNQVLPPSMRILSSFGYREEDLRYYKTRQRTLNGF